MGEHDTPRTADPVEVTEAFTAARDLLRGAEQEAERTRVDADRYARQREQEAELLVGKARRLLAAAEEKAAVIIATARASAPTVAAGDRLDLDAVAVAAAVVEQSVAASKPDLDVPVSASADRSTPSELDRMLASAIAHAVDAALPSATAS